MAKAAKDSTGKAMRKGKEGRKTRSKKDPNAPKKGLSAYMFFSQDWRERVKAENPDASFGQIGKLLGDKWKQMSEAEKKPYNDMALRDKKRAEDEKAAYDAQNGGHGGDDDDE